MSANNCLHSASSSLLRCCPNGGAGVRHPPNGVKVSQIALQRQYGVVGGCERTPRSTPLAGHMRHPAPIPAGFTPAAPPAPPPLAGFTPPHPAPRQHPGSTPLVCPNWDTTPPAAPRSTRQHPAAPRQHPAAPRRFIPLVTPRTPQVHSACHTPALRVAWLLALPPRYLIRVRGVRTRQRVQAVSLERTPALRIATDRSTPQPTVFRWVVGSTPQYLIGCGSVLPAPPAFRRGCNPRLKREKHVYI